MGPNPPPNTTARARNRPERRTARIPQDPGRFAYRYLLRLLLILERLVLVGGVAAGVDVDQVTGALGVGADRDLVGGAVLGVVDVVAVGLVGVAEGVHPVGGRRDLGQHRGDAAVAHHAGPGRDQLADDDVLLEADQRVALALDGRLGQHPCGLLEGGRRQPRLGDRKSTRLNSSHTVISYAVFCLKKKKKKKKKKIIKKKKKNKQKVAR